MKKAFDVWSQAADIKFRKIDDFGSADIRIRFGRREHGDGYENAFDGREKFEPMFILIKKIKNIESLFRLFII